jgi:hypothetical protein
LFDQWLGKRAIMRLTVGQDEGKKTAFIISNCMDLRITPASRPTNGLILLPPLWNGPPLFSMMIG